ncbi:hypothetical protein RHMOL_Rhmol01G0032400 [Rhododendron molle]|uniref:Uncharacterized protein n=1 Tax=Rhododendron molle TaxID=49168 RepID=A0ACC0PZ64_RHOML|nr:hypothetical protein RHMOL_Rhmol01G0032400 [Rhododendron molle]
MWTPAVDCGGPGGKVYGSGEEGVVRGGGGGGGGGGEETVKRGGGGRGEQTVERGGGGGGEETVEQPGGGGKETVGRSGGGGGEETVKRGGGGERLPWRCLAVERERFEIKRRRRRGTNVIPIFGFGRSIKEEEWSSLPKKDRVR